MLSQMTHEERERLRAEFLREASAGFDWMFDPNRQSDMRTFTQREDRGMEIGTALAQWVIEHHVGEDSGAKPSPAGAVCPDCGGSAPMAGSGEGHVPGREVVSRAGEVAIHRPGHVCPRCRRTFFPSGS
jgi:hypothetical protein